MRAIWCIGIIVLSAVIFTFLPNPVRGNSPPNIQSLCLAESAHFRNIAFAPDGAKAYVTGDGIGGIIVIDTGTNSVIGKIPMTVNSDAIAFSIDGKKAYITSIGHSPIVSVIDLSSNSVITTLPIGNGQFEPKGIAMAKDGQEIYVAVTEGRKGQLLILNSKTGTITQKIPVQNIGESIVVSPDGAKAFLREKSISTIDLAKKIEIHTLSTADIGAIAISQNGNYLALSESGRPGKVEILNANENRKIASISLNDDPITKSNPIGMTLPFSMAFTPDSQRLYVAHHTTRPGKISVIDIKTKSVISTVNAGTFPTGLAITPDGTKLYVLAPTDESLSISVIDVKQNRLSGTISGINNSMSRSKNCH